MLDEGVVKPSDRVVIFNTGAVQKYVEAMRVDLPAFEGWDQVARDLGH